MSATPKCKSSPGYALSIVVMILALMGMLIAASLMRQSTRARTIHATKIRAEEFMQAETTIGHTVSWLRANSQKLAVPFTKERFYSSFDKTNPTYGANDTEIFKVPTQVKLASSNNSAIVIADAGTGINLATPGFPTSWDLTTLGSFNLTNEFAAADLGEVPVRLTLVNAVAYDPTKDYGPPPNAAPETDFYPIYRVDAMNDLTEGSHVYGTIVGKLIHRFDIGIYGQDYLELRQQCDSYKSSEGQYAVGRRRANCAAGSNSTSAVHKNEEIYGTLRTNGSIQAVSPWGGNTCADFTAGCPNKGETCAGEDCGVPLLDQFQAWNVYCPVDQGNKTVSGNETLGLAGSNPSQKCWDTVVIQGNSRLVLTSTSVPYFFKTLTLQNNSNSVLDIQPDNPNKAVEVYVLNITGNAFNGNQVFNINNRPRNFVFNYLGTNELTLNGTAAMNVALTAPNAQVTVSGSFTYSGALLARRLVLSGAGQVHYDEDLGGFGTVVDMQYSLKDLVQYYR
uniref:Putative membrane protein n=1 Tax=wastewater metagenome TaxID=527639 RepID=A0A0A8KWY1_9ZZZZ